MPNVARKPLSLSEIRSNLQRFAHEWAGETREHAESQTFWNELFECFGVRRREVAVFEQGARRLSTGGRGRIDVFVPRMLIGEHKSFGEMRDDSADAQAYDYLLGGSISAADMPRFVLSCDFETMRITDLEAPGGPAVVTFPVAGIADHTEKLAFIAGYAPVSGVPEHEEAASIEAAAIMASLYEALTDDADTGDIRNAADEDEATLAASILLTRLLFLMFGDDAGLWDNGLFSRFIATRTAEDGSDLGAQLRALFEILDKPAGQRPHRTDEVMRQFPHVGGSLFHDPMPTVFFDRAMRDELLRAGGFDWTTISPAVFGSLFQSVKKKEARRQGGEHYTTETNVLKCLRPLFLDDVKRRVDDAWNDPAALRRVHRSFASMRYVDFACGSGNFLIVAYREMRKLELDILVRLKELRGEASWQQTLDDTDDLLVSLDQFHGVEINWWPAKIAEVAMFLVDHQANREMIRRLGNAPTRLPITTSAHIVHANALEIDWADVVEPGPNVLVFGNPPFGGHKDRSEQQTAELRTVWGSEYEQHLDYVTAWHHKAVEFYGDIDGQWAFVTTNSITQGQPVAALFGHIFARGWKIKFAHRTFEWTSEVTGQAHVHVVIVGFTRARGRRRLFDYTTVRSNPHEVVVPFINAYLVDGADVLVRDASSPITTGLPEVVFGSMANDGGGLLVSAADLPDVMADPIAAKYVRPFRGATELINAKERWCLWMDTPDFRASDIQASPILRQRVGKVRVHRRDSSREATRQLARTPHLFGERRQPSTSYLCIPRHYSGARSYFTAARYEADVICGDANFLAEDADGLLFAVISSSMFMTWQRTIGGALKSDPRFSATIAWNTLPLPAMSDRTRARVITAGHRVLDARAEHPERSLADHYNPLAMDPDLLRAHDALDLEVDKAFGARGRLKSERERQTLLFTRYADLTAPLAVPARPR